MTGSRDRHPRIVVTTRLASATTTHALMVASRDAQLLVIGSRGSGGFAGLPLGSASQQLLHHALCSVMLVRTASDVWSVGGSNVVAICPATGDTVRVG